MATRGGEAVCPACARGAVTPEGTWVTLPLRRQRARKRRNRARREVVRPPTHGASTADRADTIYAGVAPLRLGAMSMPMKSGMAGGMSSAMAAGVQPPAVPSTGATPSSRGGGVTPTKRPWKKAVPVPR